MSESLGKIAKGAAIAFAGMLAFTFFEFVTRVIIARHATPGEYGAFSIGFALLNIFVMVSCLGLQGGATRCIAYFRGKGENGTVAGIVYSSLQLSIAAGLFFFLVVFFSSDFLKEIFHLEQSMVLKLFAIAIPFLTVIEILSYIFIGFDRIKEKVFFRDILMYLLRVSGIAFAFIIGFGFLGMMYAYLLPTVIVAVVFAGYAIKKLSIKLKDNAVVRKKLLRFSIPLLVTFISTVIITRADTLMLGYFKTSDIVGLYNAAVPFAQLLPIFLTSIGFIYVPISSQLYSKNLVEDIRRNYAVLTKWVVIVTLPFFFIMFLFPEAVLNIIFGSSYEQAGNALRILLLGALVQVITGPNALTLVVTAKTKLNMLDDLIGLIVNLSLNFLLIPTLGIAGAAIASSTSLISINVLKSAQIFWMNKIHPFTLNFIKVLITSTIFISVIYILLAHLTSTTITIWMLMMFFFLFLTAQVAGLIITKSFDKDDMILLQDVKRILNKNAKAPL
ncbi:MAG: flippase [Candidatus Methanoperedens sp.]|nr:flippase [Candidatus Methanoperedens sp.]MCZ7371823.1 flippase [Candidatus Methanoperedens sp.]